MSFDPGLAERCREQLSGISGLEEKRMFGGLGFLLNGNMACGVHGERLIVRVGAEQHQEALTREHAEPFDLTGRSMAGWVFVAPEGLLEDSTLADWIRQGVLFSRSLPPK